jgi:hypothetical protein
VNYLYAMRTQILTVAILTALLISFCSYVAVNEHNLPPFDKKACDSKIAIAIKSRIDSGFSSVLNERIKNNQPTLAGVHYGPVVDGVKYGFDHFVAIVGKTADAEYIMNDPGAPDGDGANNPSASNIINDTKRKSGYTIFRIDCISSNAT